MSAPVSSLPVDVRVELAELRALRVVLLALLAHAEAEGSQVIAIKAVRGALDGGSLLPVQAEP